LTRYVMIFYHGSPIGGLSELKPALSEHGKPYIYFAMNPLVALLYAVKPVLKPFSFYPYGFDQKGAVVYSEYFENAFEILYKCRRGYLYECDSIPNPEQPTQINCAYTCLDPVTVDRATEISDLYDYFTTYIQSGRFLIKHFEQIPEKELSFVLDDMRRTITKYDLYHHPESPMAIFIRNHFPLLF